MLMLCSGVDRPIAYDSIGIGVGVLFASASGGLRRIFGGERRRRPRKTREESRPSQNLQHRSALLELFGHEVYNRLV